MGGKKRFSLQNVKLRRGGAARLHPSVDRARSMLQPEFERFMLLEQKILEPPILENKHLQIVLGSLNKNLDLLAEFEQKCEKCVDAPDASKQIWDWIVDTSNEEKTHDAIKNLAAETLFRLCYPRVDVNVTKQMNHLAKSPFCIHPKTGRVCVPIPDPETFNFEDTPTLAELVAELDAHKASGQSPSNATTKLTPYLQFFRQHCDRLDRERNLAMEVDA